MNKPNKSMMIDTLHVNDFRKIQHVVEFCDIVEDMGNENELLEFVDFSYWHHHDDNQAQQAIMEVQNILTKLNEHAISQRLGELHLLYLAN